MVTKIKKSIANSKRKKDFKQRQHRRIEKKNKAKSLDSKQFVDKKQRREERMKKKAEEERGSNDSAMEEDEDEISSDSELERELAEDQAAKDPEKLDETVFQ